MRPAIALTATTACLLLWAGCIDPSDRRPGLWLSGEVAKQAPADWSFTDAHGEIYIETRTPYLLRHSVTIVCTSLDGRLYVGARNPSEKRWVAHVARNPDVRLEIGDTLYEGRLERVEDPAQREAVYRAYARKYGWELAAPEARPELWTWRVLPRG